MGAQTMWKGAVRFGSVRVPVKLYAAVQDRDVHFRLLHRKDKVPVRQAMVDEERDEVVPYAEARRAYTTEDGDLVILNREDMDALEPEPSRDIEVLEFLPPAVIDHRWYLRPYYLGPDGSPGAYAALIEALERSGREGLVRWVMRKKDYVGALRLHQGYPMLISLRRAEEVMSVEELEAPKGRQLDKKELSMAHQLMEMLEGPFEPREYRDEYRERVLDLIETKRRGGSVKVVPLRRAEPSEDLSKALEASLQQERRSA